MSRFKSQIAGLARRRPASLTLGVLCGLALTAAAHHFVLRHDPIRLRAWWQVAPRLQQAEEETRGEVEAATGEVERFLDDRAAHARAFASDVLSLRGKWAYLSDYFHKGTHEEYIAGCFERHLFRGDELRAVVESSIARYVTEVQGAENRLLVDLRADLADDAIAGDGYLPALDSEEAFRAQYEAMLERILPVVSRDVGVTVTREMAAFVGSEIAARILADLGVSLATRMGVSGGILGAGASSGAVTFGVGLVAAILVDMALDWVIRKAGYDPEGEIAAKVQESLERLGTLILEGDALEWSRYRDARWGARLSWDAAEREAARESARSIEAGGGLGLRHQLRRVDDLRSRLRKAALRGLILEGGAQ
ncbi:hypothetical protein [Tautonia rosea]|uniref:hypothetical protein n=1 Tax=Tautonia rosea TaxID=2728037 RepID=UPI0014749AEB|nr:hypothetical protein [Tautonia rosea]